MHSIDDYFNLQGNLFAIIGRFFTFLAVIVFHSPYPLFDEIKGRRDLFCSRCDANLKGKISIA